MIRIRLCACSLAVLFVLPRVGFAAPDPPDLPPAGNWALFGLSQSGQDIGLPPGATTAYALGRSLLNRGETDAALVYLNRAFSLAPDSWLITAAFAFALSEAGYARDAVSLYADLVAAEPDSLSQRRQYALLLGRTGRPQAALDQVLELRRRGQSDPGLTRLHADLLGNLGRIDDAIELYREAIEGDASLAEHYYLAAAGLLEAAQRFDRMAELLREGAARLPTSRNLVQPLLRYLVHQGRHDSARKEAAAADARRREAGLAREPELTLELADMLLAGGELPAAQQVLAAALEDGRRSLAVETLLARLHLSMGRSGDALTILERASEHWPGEAELHYLRGRALELLDEVVPARQQLQMAVTLQPDNAQYRVALLRFLVMHPQHHEMDSEELRRLLLEHADWATANLEPEDSHGHLILAYCYRHLGDLSAACRHFRLAHAVHETRLIAGLELSLCLQQSGLQDDALAVLRDLHDEYPDDPDVANNLAYTLAERGEDLALAESLVRQALKSDPHNGAYLDSLGWVLYRQGDYEGAFHWLIEAVNQRPDDPVILEHLGMTLFSLGRGQEALDILQRALAGGGDAARLKSLIAEVERGP